MLNSDIWWQVFVGIGVANLSAIVTLMVFHWIISPRIRFSEAILSRKSGRRDGCYYEATARKTGFIDLIETSAVCRVEIKDVGGVGSSRWTYYTVPLSFSNSIIFKRDTRFLELKLYESEMSDPEASPLLHSKVTIARPELGLRFEDLFMSFDNVRVQLFVEGHDRFTGIKKLYDSRYFGFWAFREGKWSRDRMRLRPE